MRWRPILIPLALVIAALAVVTPAQSAWPAPLTCEAAGRMDVYTDRGIRFLWSDLTIQISGVCTDALRGLQTLFATGEGWECYEIGETICDSGGFIVKLSLTDQRTGKTRTIRQGWSGRHLTCCDLLPGKVSPFLITAPRALAFRDPLAAVALGAGIHDIGKRRSCRELAYRYHCRYDYAVTFVAAS
jgi:hypothetical protein